MDTKNDQRTNIHHHEQRDAASGAAQGKKRKARIVGTSLVVSAGVRAGAAFIHVGGGGAT